MLGVLTTFLLAAAPGGPPEPLHAAAFTGQLEALDAALAAGTPVDVKDAREWTALHWAALGGQTAAAGHLLERGADPDARGQFDMTPLHWAALRGHDGVVAELTGHGARLEARNLYGLTPLHEAATEAVVKALLQAGAKLEQRENTGLTPLFTAQTKEVGQALLKNGADLHARARDGRTLFDMLVVNTLQPQGLMLYGRRSAGRLRGDEATVALQVRNVSAAPLKQVSLRAQTEAADVGVAPVIAQLAPGQLTAVSFALRRRPQVAEEVFPLVVTVSLEGRALGTFELELDNSRSLTPADEGMVRLGRATLRTTGSRWTYAAFLAVPLLVLAGWLLLRRRR